MYLIEEDEVPATGYPAVQLPEVSRRSFLKLMGVTAGAQGADQLAGASALAEEPRDAATESEPWATAALPSYLPPEVRRLLDRAFDELSWRGFSFSLQRASVLTLPERPALAGLLLRDNRPAPQPQGADIALTINTRYPRRSVLYALIGRSDQKELELTTMMLTADGQRYQHRQVYPRARAAIIAGLAQQAANPLPLAAGDLRQPDEAAWVDRATWLYGYASDPMWLLVTGAGGRRELHLRYTSCQEYRASRSATSLPVSGRGWQSPARPVTLTTVL